MFLYGSFGLSCSSLTYYVGYYDYFSPYSTNAFNIFISSLCHIGIVIGPAALYGMRMVKYTVYPQEMAKIIPQ